MTNNPIIQFIEALTNGHEAHMEIIQVLSRFTHGFHSAHLALPEDQPVLTPMHKEFLMMMTRHDSSTELRQEIQYLLDGEDVNMRDAKVGYYYLGILDVLWSLVMHLRTHRRS